MLDVIPPEADVGTMVDVYSELFSSLVISLAFGAPRDVVAAVARACGVEPAPIVAAATALTNTYKSLGIMPEGDIHLPYLPPYSAFFRPSRAYAIMEEENKYVFKAGDATVKAERTATGVLVTARGYGMATSENVSPSEVAAAAIDGMPGLLSYPFAHVTSLPDPSRVVIDAADAMVIFFVTALRPGVRLVALAEGTVYEDSRASLMLDDGELYVEAGGAVTPLARAKPLFYPSQRGGEVKWKDLLMLAR